MTINPHFENKGSVFTNTDWEGFADALATSMATAGGNNVQTVVKIYDTESAPPNLPLAVKTKYPGLHPVSNGPRELALCLSYYSGVNMIGGAIGIRPSTAQMGYAMDLSARLQNAGGADIDWSVYSRVDGAFRPVSGTWVDNEWDIMRSRGLRPTTRTLGTASE
jgi:hypothetical protein